MQITVIINVPETVHYESVREYLTQTLIEFQTDTANEFEIDPETITFEIKPT